jgi:hypothetical protein
MNELNRLKANDSAEISSLNIQKLIKAGPIDYTVLAQALRDLVDRHESLRATFAYVDGDIRQQFSDRPALNLNYLDLRDAEDPGQVARATMQAQMRQYFDCQQGPLYAARLMQLTDAQCYFVFTINHIICDGWTLRVITDELLQLYEGYCLQKPVVLPPVKWQMSDYAAWESHLINSDQAREYRSYWTRSLHDAPLFYLSAYYEAPPDPPGHDYRKVLTGEVERFFPQLSGKEYYPNIFGLLHRVKTHIGGSYRLVISRELYQAVEDAGVKLKCSLFAFTLTSLYLLLYKLTGNKDMVVGVQAAIRDNEKLEYTVGWLVNTLLVRHRLDSSATFAQCLKAVQEDFSEAYEHKMIPLERTLQELNISLDAIGSVNLNYLDFGNGSELGNLDNGHQSGTFFSYFDLDCNVTKYNNALELCCTYKNTLFSPQVVESFFAAYLRLLGRITRHPGHAVAALVGKVHLPAEA